MIATRADERRVRPVITVVVFIITGLVSVTALADVAVMRAMTRDIHGLRRGQWWRFVSPILVQSSGWGQLVLNIAGLIVIGAALEQRVQRSAWIVVYLVGGVGSIALLTRWRPGDTGGGSSDAIAALIGALAARPQTIGYGLTDSPAALLTWIVEKVYAWTHAPEALTDERYRRRHPANVLLYWLTGTPTSAANNIYGEYAALFADPNSFTNSGVPTAIVVFAEDPAIRRFAEQTNTIVRWTDVDDGGHFAALEQPGQLLADLRSFVADLPTN